MIKHVIRIGWIVAVAAVVDPCFNFVASGADQPEWTSVFADEDWYKTQAGPEEVYTGKLVGDKPTEVSTLMRDAYYSLGDRTVFTSGQKHPALDRLVGQDIEVRGKAVDMELEGQSLKELWPGAVRATEVHGEKHELLAEQETVAEFRGLEYQQCRGRTALCPDKCGHSGNFARFRILKYLVYKRPGKYGDPQKEEFMTQVDDNLGQLKLPEEQVKLLRELKPADEVRLGWRHDYVTQDGASRPERPLTGIVKLTQAEAKQLTGEPLLEAPPVNDTSKRAPSAH